MAETPMDATPADIDAQLRQIISNLYMLLVQTHDYHGSSTSSAMTGEIRALIQNLLLLTQTSRRLPTKVPLDLIEYVERKRNPDVYKREIVEDVMKSNQMQKGRAEAFSTFRDLLGREMMSAIPDIRDDVREVVEATGGRVES